MINKTAPEIHCARFVVFHAQLHFALRRYARYHAIAVNAICPNVGAKNIWRSPSASVSYRRHVAGRIQPCFRRGNRRSLRPIRETCPQAPPAARMDPDLSGSTHWTGKGFHFKHRERQEGALPKIFGDIGHRVRNVPGTAYAWGVIAHPAVKSAHSPLLTWPHANTQVLLGSSAFVRPARTDETALMLSPTGVRMISACLLIPQRNRTHRNRRQLFQKCKRNPAWPIFRGETESFETDRNHAPCPSHTEAIFRNGHPWDQ